jgi:hypothetical protein
MHALIIDELVYLYCEVCKSREPLPLMTVKEWWALPANAGMKEHRIYPTFVEEENA